jgi:hypothetical protein
MRIALALLLVSSTAYAERNELSYGGGFRALHSSSANAVTEDSLAGGQLGYARSLDLPILPDVQLWAEAGFGWGGTDGMMFQTLSTEVSSINFTAGGRARYELHRLAVASAHIDLGTARAAFSLRDDAGHTASDHGWGALTNVGAALDLFAIRSKRFALGLRVDFGYVYASGIDLVATPESSSDGTLQLQMTAAGLGSLDLSGATFNAGLVSTF